MQHQQTLPRVREDPEHASGIQEGKLRAEGAAAGVRQPSRKGTTVFTQNRNLSAEIDRLTHIKVQQEKDLEELRLSMTDQVALQKRVSEDLAMMVVLFVEI